VARGDPRAEIDGAALGRSHCFLELGGELEGADDLDLLGHDEAKHHPRRARLDVGQDREAPLPPHRSPARAARATIAPPFLEKAARGELIDGGRIDVLVARGTAILVPSHGIDGVVMSADRVVTLYRRREVARYAHPNFIMDRMPADIAGTNAA